MNNLFKLKKQISISSADLDEDDILNTKKTLQNMGYYKTPKYGMTPYSDDIMFDGIKMFQKDNNLKVDGVMNPQGATETKVNQIMKKAEYGAAGAYQGLSLGWSDEIRGGLEGVGYALGSLNKNWNTSGESMTEAYKRGYTKSRDEQRALLEEGRKNAPIITGISEAAGAIASPARIFKAPTTAPLSVLKRKSLLDTLSTGSIYGIGVSDHEKKDYAENIALSIGGNYSGHKLGDSIWGSSRGRVLEKKITTQGVNSTINSINNTLSEKKKKK